MAFEKTRKFAVKLFGSHNDRLVKSYMGLVEAAGSFEPILQQLSDKQLAAKTQEFRDRLSAGESDRDLIPEVFAVVREVSDRHLGIRNSLLDEQGFNRSSLGESSALIYDKLRTALSEGQSLHELNVPVEYNAELRRLYPESKPPFRFRHFDVQLIGGAILYDGRIAEMATGEGKTLMATLAAFMVYLTGRKVHLVTVNDYLAKRDAQWMTPVYNALGMTVGAIQSDMDPSGDIRKQQYNCDVTYGTNNEFGFDYLRDNMKGSMEQMAQGPLHYAIIDEVDSILIDEARTPLIISGPAFDDVTRYKKADQITKQLIQMQSGYDNLKKRVDALSRDIANARGELSDAKKNKDNDRIKKAQQVISVKTVELDDSEARLETSEQYYEVELDKKSVQLNHDGIGAAQKIAGIGSFYTGSNMDWPHLLNQSLRAHITFDREKDYVVLDGKIVIVDDFTGRLMHGRQWSDGLHQAIEAKESVTVKEESQTLATITFQNFFKLYGQIAGMTGTALTEADEFMNIYGLEVISIPTNRPCVRQDKDDVIYKTISEKFTAIADEIKEISDLGQPILVGTVSIEKSEALSALLTTRGIEHEVLNAKQHEREAVIIAKAGAQHADRLGKMRGNVTIATNMAGRGTDIKLAAGVADLGGLYILGTERHESRRIDNQLRGRAGRQGDAGSSQFFLSFDDDLMSIFAPEWMVKALSWFPWQEGEPIYHKKLTRVIEKSQRKVEQRNFETRKSLLEYDQVMDYQRKDFYRRRRDILSSNNLHTIIEPMIESVVQNGSGHMLGSDYSAHCIVEWARVTFSVELVSRDMQKLEAKEIERLIKQAVGEKISEDISRSIGEYLEDYSDPSSWNLAGISKWAMSSFGVNFAQSKLKSMTPDEIADELTDLAIEQIDNKDFSMLTEFLDKDFAGKRFCEWIKTKFETDLSPDELEDLEIAKVSDLVIEKTAQKYRQRKIEYPVEFAVNMVSGGDRENIYAFDAVASWAKKKYDVDFTAADLSELKPQELYSKLLALSKEYNNGKLDDIIKDKASSMSRVDFVAWANQRFDTTIAIESEEVDVSEKTSLSIESADDEKIIEAVIKAGSQFLCSELVDLERYVLIQICDSSWKDHLYAMDHLKSDIWVRSFAEKDPKTEYKREGYQMFIDMLAGIDDKVTDVIFKVHLESGVSAKTIWNVSSASHDDVDQFALAQRQKAAAQAPQTERKVKQIKMDTPKVGRNDPCPCNSGKKYKKCCGK